MCCSFVFAHQNDQILTSSSFVQFLLFRSCPHKLIQTKSQTKLTSLFIVDALVLRQQICSVWCKFPMKTIESNESAIWTGNWKRLQYFSIDFHFFVWYSIIDQTGWSCNKYSLNEEILKFVDLFVVKPSEICELHKRNW